MSEIASAFVSIAPSAKGFGSKLNSQVGGELGGVGKRLGGTLGKAIKLGALAGVAGLGAAFGAGLKAAAEYEKIQAQTAAVIKSTGGAAGVTAKHVADLGSKIEGYSAFGNEAVETGANLLLTFTNIKNEAGKGNKIFDRATTTITDMATALGTAPRDSAIQLGKALNDPVKGITALQRVGVSFTEDQKSQIKTLAESGKTMQAQKIILGELNKEFGGSAKAAGQTFAGSLARLKNQFGDLLRDAVMPLLPALTSFVQILATKLPSAFAAVAGFFTPIINAIQRTFQAFSALSGDDGVQAFGELMDNALGNTGRFVGPLRVVGQSILDFGKTASGAASSFAPLVKSAIAAGVEFGKSLLPAVVTLAKSIQANFLPVLAAAGKTFSTVVLPAVTGLVSYLAGKLLPVFQQVAGVIATQVVPIVAEFARFFYATVYPAVVQVATVVAHNLKPVFDQLVATFRSQVLPTVVVLLAKFREWQPTIERVAAFILKLTGKLLVLAAVIIGKVLPFVIRLVGFLVGNAIRAIAGVTDAFKAVTGVIGAVGDAFKGLWNKASMWLGKAMDFITGMPGKIKDAFSGIWSGLAEGLKAAVNSVLHLPLTIPRIDTHIPKIGVVGGQTLIPALAKGGVLTKPTLFLGGEAGTEAVLPLPVLDRMLTSAHGSRDHEAKRPLHIHIGDREFVTMIDERIGAHVDLTNEMARAL